MLARPSRRLAAVTGCLGLLGSVLGALVSASPAQAAPPEIPEDAYRAAVFTWAVVKSGSMPKRPGNQHLTVFWTDDDRLGGGSNEDFTCPAGEQLLESVDQAPNPACTSEGLHSEIIEHPDFPWGQAYRPSLRKIQIQSPVLVRNARTGVEKYGTVNVIGRAGGSLSWSGEVTESSGDIRRERSGGSPGGRILGLQYSDTSLLWFSSDSIDEVVRWGD